MASERNGVAGSSPIFFQFIWRIGTIFKRTWIKEDIKEVGEGIKKKKKEGRKEDSLSKYGLYFSRVTNLFLWLNWTCPGLTPQFCTWESPQSRENGSSANFRVHIPLQTPYHSQSGWHQEKAEILFKHHAEKAPENAVRKSLQTEVCNAK